MPTPAKRLRSRGRARPGFAAFGLYSVLSFLFFGLRLFGSDTRFVGTGRDPEQFIWAFAWWPHAIMHGDNPFVTHAIWAPGGVNLTWTTSVPGLALAFAPVTLLVGPVSSFNLAEILTPALAACTAFLLCRYLTGRASPSLLGGYLFGFSSYVIDQQLGHPHMTAVFLLPLVALVVLRYLDGGLAGRELVLRLGVVLALQLLISTEILFTLTLALAGSLILAFLLAPERRPALLRSVPPLAGAYLIAGVLTAPFIYYLVTDFQPTTFHAPEQYVTDLLNVVVPTDTILSGKWWAHSIATRFSSELPERGAFIGAPLLLILGWFGLKQWRTGSGRFLLASFALALLASLGAWLNVAGHRLITLPWEHVEYLPLFNDVLPARLAIYCEPWTGLLRPVARLQRVGGAIVYRLDGPGLCASPPL